MLSYKSYNIKKLSPILFYYLRFLINRLGKEENKIKLIRYRCHFLSAKQESKKNK